MSKLSQDELDFVFGLLNDAMKQADEPAWIESIMAKLNDVVATAERDEKNV